MRTHPRSPSQHTLVQRLRQACVGDISGHSSFPILLGVRAPPGGALATEAQQALPGLVVSPSRLGPHLGVLRQRLCLVLPLAGWVTQGTTFQPKRRQLPPFTFPVLAQSLLLSWPQAVLVPSFRPSAPSPLTVVATVVKGYLRLPSTSSVPPVLWTLTLFFID